MDSAGWPTENLKRQYSVVHIPTTLILDHTGREIDRFVDIASKPEEFFDYFRSSFSGGSTYADILDDYNANPDDLQLAYRLFMKHLKRGDLKSQLEIGRKILDRPNEAASLDSGEMPGGRMTTILERTEFHIRTSLHRAGTEKLMRHMMTFPEIRFSPRAFRAVAKSFNNGQKLDNPEQFFKTALMHHPNDERILTEYIAFCSATGNGSEKGLHIVSERIQSGRECSPELIRKYAGLLVKNGQGAESVYGPGFIEGYSGDEKVLAEYASFWVDQSTNLDSALETAKRAVTLKNSHTNWYLLAKIYWKRGDLQNAAEAQKTAIRLSNGLIPAYSDFLRTIEDSLK